MDTNGPRDWRRVIFLVAIAGVIATAGLLAAISAPATSPRSHKADAYGGPVQPTPTNPKTVGECDKYWGTAQQNKGAERKQCVAIAHKNAALKKCNKKKGAAEQQRRAEKACNDKYSAALKAIDPDAADYGDKSKAADDAYEACRKKAQGIS